MNSAAADIVVGGFLEGFFEVFNAMLTKNYQCEPGDTVLADEAALRKHLETCPVQMSAMLQEGLGQVALLFTTADALAFLAALTAQPTSEEISAEDKETLREVAEPALGGGVANLMAKCERGAVQLDGVKVDIGVNASALAATLGGSPICAAFSFGGPDEQQGSGFALFSADMESLVPPALLGSPRPKETSQSTLTPDELNDILGGFPAADLAQAPAAPLGAGGDRRQPSLLHGTENLDLVLDIRLLATARLGRVEMPLGDILSLGPGSILEVGHLVDEPIELLINDKLIARGDVVVVDEKFGLRITEIVSQRERIESLR